MQRGEAFDDLDLRVELLKAIPVFARAPLSALRSAAADARTTRFAGGTVLAGKSEDDRLLLILAGTATATAPGPDGPIPIGTLNRGDLCGEVIPPMPPSGHDLVVTAVGDVVAMELDAGFARRLLGSSSSAEQAPGAVADQLEAAYLATAGQFATLDQARLAELARRAEPMDVRKGNVIYRAGQRGSRCYVLRAGQIELTEGADDGAERVALVGPGTMFGEEVALTDGPYANTATALTASEVLAFDAGELDDVIVQESSVRESLFELLHMRDRPRRVSRILVHERLDDDGTEVRILKDATRGAYYRLTADGWFLWQQLDGKHSLRELTLAYLGYARMFAPRLVANEVAELRAAGFVRGPRLRRVLAPRLSLWNRLVDRLRPFVEFRVPLRGSARLITFIYEHGGRVLFSRPALLVLAAVAVAGFVLLLGRAASPGRVLPFAAALVAIPVSLACHELGHALTAKAYGREVSLGVGWYWFAPVVYTDTTDTWLSGKWPRIAVSIAGPYTSAILGGGAAIVAWLLPVGPIADLFWTFALISFVWGAFNLDPLLEYDGYYILSDLLERPNLRSDSLRWLGSEMVDAVRRSGLGAVRTHAVEITYGLLAVVYVVFVAMTTVALYGLLVEDWVATWLPGGVAPVVGLGLGGLVLLSSGATLLGELRGARSRH